MHIIEMKLAGHMNKGDVPAYFATIHRVAGNAYITVKLISTDGEREHRVEADNSDDVYSMAECLQYHLDGCKGTNSMVHDYYRILENFTN
jgi:hypothetical protein